MDRFLGYVAMCAWIISSNLDVATAICGQELKRAKLPVLSLREGVVAYSLFLLSQVTITNHGCL